MSVDIGMRSFIDYFAKHPSILIGVLSLYIFVYFISVLLFGRGKGRNPFLIDHRRPAEPFVHDTKLRDAVLKTRFKENRIPKNLDAIIIGSGAGGLSAGVLLTRAGKKVLVLEQHDQAGGCCHSFVEKGFEFDTGIHYVGNMVEESPFKILLDQLTCGQLRWAKLDDVSDTIILGKSSETKLYKMKSGKNRYYENLIDLFPKEKAAILAYKNLVKDASDSFLGIMVLKALPRLLVQMLLITGLYCILIKCFRKGYTSKSLQEVLDELTDDKVLQLVLSYPIGAYNLAPKDVPFLFHAAIIHHYDAGGYYPVNGSSEIAFHMVQVIQKGGGSVLMQAPVTKILCDANGRSVGVQVGKNNVNVHAKYIISDAGVVNTFKKLLPENVAKASNIYPLIEKVGQGISFISVFIGLEGSSSELKLPSDINWLFGKKNINKAVEAFHSLNIDEIETAEFPYVGFSFSSAKDPEWERKYPGKSSLLIYVMAKWEWFEQWEDKENHCGDRYKDVKDNIGSRLWQLCVDIYPQLDGKKVYMNVGTPVTTNYSLSHHRGASFGLNHNMKRFSAEVVSKLLPNCDINGLYLTGQDVVTCGFIPSILSGLLCASQILNRNMYNDLLKLSKSILREDSFSQVADLKKEE